MTNDKPRWRYVLTDSLNIGDVVYTMGVTWKVVSICSRNSYRHFCLTTQDGSRASISWFNGTQRWRRIYAND